MTEEPSVPSTQPVRGTLSEGALAPLLGRLQRDKATGWLRLSAMEVRGGVPVVMRCGLRLVAGRIAAVEEDVAQRATATPALPSEELRRRAAVLIALLLPCRDGVHVWEPETASAAEGDSRPPSLAETARTAVERLDDPALVRTALGPLGRTLVATPAGASSAGALTAAQAALLGRAAGGVSAADLCSHASLPEAAERDLLVLLCLGLVSWAADAPADSVARTAGRPAVEKGEAPRAPGTRARAASGKAPATPPAAKPAPGKDPVVELRREIEQAHAALRGANHFEVLGLAPDAPETEVRQAFARLARRYHPDAQRDPALEDVRPKLVDLFVAISNAHGVLKDAAARERYERAMGLGSSAPARRGGPPPATAFPPERAADEPIEARILRSEEALGAGQPWEAIRLLEEAVPAATGGLKTRARVLLGRAYAERDRPHDAEKVLLAALQDDPRSVPACLALGRLYRHRGMVKRARGMLEKALELDPRQAEARRELSALPDESSQPPPGGSLLSRLRGDRH
jgi:hypothetical protein